MLFLGEWSLLGNETGPQSGYLSARRVKHGGGPGPSAMFHRYFYGRADEYSKLALASVC